MKKIFICILLVLLLVFSSVISSFATISFPFNPMAYDTYPTIPSQVSTAWYQNYGNYDYAVMWSNQTTPTQFKMMFWNVDDHASQSPIRFYSYNGGSLGIQYDISNVQTGGNMTVSNGKFYWWNSNGNWLYNGITSYSLEGHFYSSNESAYKGRVIACKNPIYNDDGSTYYNGSTEKVISLKKGQCVYFKYTDLNKAKFLKYISATTNGDSLKMGYTTPDIQESTDYVRSNRWTAEQSSINTIGIEDFPTIRNLTTGELMYFYFYSATNDTDRINITIDPSYCTYAISGYQSGVVIDEGNTTTSSGINPPNSNTTLYDDFTNYATGQDGPNRSDYAEGLEGTVQYLFDTLFKFLKMPFVLLINFFNEVGELIGYAVNTVNAFATSMLSLFGILPPGLANIFKLAIILGVLKLIFGR